jgi:hypothetical protein
VFKPTDEELQEAVELGVKTVNDEGKPLNGIQLREATKRAKARARQVNKPADKGGLNQYKTLMEIARTLGMTVAKGITMADLCREVELQISEMLCNKKIKPGVTIVYGKGSGDHAGSRAHVVKTNVSWTMNMPYIVLKHEGVNGARTYYAHIVALYANIAE